MVEEVIVVTLVGVVWPVDGEEKWKKWGSTKVGVEGQAVGYIYTCFVCLLIFHFDFLLVVYLLFCE